MLWGEEDGSCIVTVASILCHNVGIARVMMCRVVFVSIAFVLRVVAGCSPRVVTAFGVDLTEEVFKPDIWHLVCLIDYDVFQY